MDFADFFAGGTESISTTYLFQIQFVTVNQPFIFIAVNVYRYTIDGNTITIRKRVNLEFKKGDLVTCEVCLIIYL